MAWRWRFLIPKCVSGYDSSLTRNLFRTQLLSARKVDESHFYKRGLQNVYSLDTISSKSKSMGRVTGYNTTNGTIVDGPVSGSSG